MIRMRTIIDVLSKGNLELFHSAIIGWLLNPEGDHELNDAILRGFAQTLENKGTPSLLNALGKLTASKNRQVKVRTEKATRKARYDIEITVGTLLKVIIENKTKSLGSLSQLDAYNAEGNVVVALGLCDVSFAEEVALKYPVVTYREILKILESCCPKTATNDFQVLVIHYIHHLKRELWILDKVQDRYCNGNMTSHSTIGGSGNRNHNDERFLDYYLLEKFKRHLGTIPAWSGAEWECSKNMQSGVWLANYKALPSRYSLKPELRSLCDVHQASVWQHVEVSKGVMADKQDDVVGSIQLKCSTKGSNREFSEKFKELFTKSSDEHFSSRVQDTWDTFYLFGVTLTQNDLEFTRLSQRLADLAKRVGTFS